MSVCVLMMMRTLPLNTIILFGLWDMLVGLIVTACVCIRRRGYGRGYVSESKYSQYQNMVGFIVGSIVIA